MEASKRAAGPAWSQNAWSAASSSSWLFTRPPTQSRLLAAISPSVPCPGWSPPCSELQSPGMERSITVTRISRLPAPAEVVWRHATSMPSVNREMGPWLRMTYPAEARDQSLADAAVVLGEPLFTSWILFLGLLPVERMRVTIVELEPGRRFVERSPPVLLRSWRHERSVEPSQDGCVVTDVVTAEPPFAWFSPVLRVVAERFFTHRHARLRRLFAGTPG